MAQAEKPHTSFDPSRESHVALSDDAYARLLEAGEVLCALADLTEGSNMRLDIDRGNLASLFRLLGRNTGWIADHAPVVRH